MPPTAHTTDEPRPLRRVLMIAPTPYFADRGCHVRILEEARALQDRGVDVTVATYHLGRTIAGVRTVRTVSVPWYRKLEAGPSIHKVYIDGLLLAVVLRAIRRERPDVLHAHLHEGAAIGLAARALTGVPVVFDVQGSLADEMAAHGAVAREGATFAGLTAIERRLFRWSDALVANSTAGRDMIARLSGVPAGDIAIVPDAAGSAPAATHDAADVRARLGLGDAPVIGYLGVMTEYQGVGLLIGAIATVLDKRPDARVLMMGFPDDVYRARVAARGLGHAVTFTGRVPYEEAGRYLAAVDVAVSPKVTSSEGNGKLLTYLAAGVPAVAFDTPVAREILAGHGDLVSPHTAEALAEALVRALDRPRVPPEQRRAPDGLITWSRSIEGALAAYDVARRKRRRR